MDEWVHGSELRIRLPMVIPTVPNAETTVLTESSCNHQLESSVSLAPYYRGGSYSSARLCGSAKVPEVEQGH